MLYSDTYFDAFPSIISWSQSHCIRISILVNCAMCTATHIIFNNIDLYKEELRLYSMHKYELFNEREKS